MKEYFAVDLGASNGRTILGRFDGERITLEELNRFENNYVRVGDAYYWDVLRLFSNIKEGLVTYGKRFGGTLSGIGIDTWGVDFGLIDKAGHLAGNPRAYRDPRGARGMAAFIEKYGSKTAFDLTGIWNLEFNTIFQLYDMVQCGDPQLDIADKLLMMPDLLGYIFCGRASTEYTNATTTQMLDCKTGGWSREIVDMIGIPADMLTDIQMSGNIKAPMYAHVAAETGINGTPPVICVGSHDTASAVASVPAKTDNFAFLSSGTWSLMGVISDTAWLSDAAYDNKFSNEGTVGGRYRPLRNIMGLWIIQNCKREWDREQKMSWDDIVAAAKAAPAFKSFIDVNAHDFFEAGNMVRKIQQFCADTGQSVPQSKGEVARVVYESLAMGYKEAFDGFEQIKGGRIDVLHIVGGGSNNKMLNQLTANALDRDVIAGPGEATAIGNLMVQAKSTGDVKNTAEMREVICRSFDVEHYEPQDSQLWREMFDKYLKAVKK